MKDHPIIGISSSRLLLEGNYLTGMPKTIVNQDYVDAVSAADGIPLIIPSTASREELCALVNLCDGILISGGMDIDPILYHELPHPCCGAFDLEVDRSNLDLVHIAMQSGKAILGICRGMQLINIALNGTLYQDIPSQCDGAGGHKFCYIRMDTVHTVDLEPESAICEIFGKKSIEVNSLHHQAVKDLGEGVRVTAKAKDGIAEAIEVPGKNIIAVQWHPEMMLQRSSEMLCLMKDFVNRSQNHSL
ncbi:MAG: gamma-glutamyl-gamma-aminobutyrate hydrolase family protein [Lachnospiraceae bacterium]|nr:gamma-glutamyl-gamma-aminobutyrate hydrolase family protein [Lachnospiraceae bacterium]